MVHTLRLDNYSPTPRKLVLGTNSSYGTESIKIERGAGWDGLNLTATWHIPGREEPLRVALLDGDAMDVPPEVTKEAKDGVLVLAGLASGVQRASCNVEYLIIEQAGVYGGADAEPTPELAAQVLQAVQDARDAAKDADQRATNAENVANSVREDADNGKFIGPVGPQGPVQVAYVLNDPVPFTATGAQPISALAGANTILTDADTVEVTGRADPIKRIEDLEAAVASIN